MGSAASGGRIRRGEQLGRLGNQGGVGREGNAFEADAVYGVENSRDPDVSEVTTHEIPDDDVPGKYLDNDEHIA